MFEELLLMRSIQEIGWQAASLRQCRTAPRNPRRQAVLCGASRIRDRPQFIRSLTVQRSLARQLPG